MSESNLGLNLQQLQVEQYAGTRYVREVNSKTSSKAGGTADIKIIRPGIRLCIPGLFALRKILFERKNIKRVIKMEQNLTGGKQSWNTRQA